ncbi:MAG: phosphatase PAP2 family protein [Anaerolineae bacterium]|nr:phosphatase PAP2 family protein [Anaerolineae bacterium]
MNGVLALLSRWDEACSRWCTLPGEGRVWRLCAVGAHLGDGALWLAAGLAVWLLGGARLREVTVRAALCVAAGAAIATALKYAIRRSRPQERTEFYALQADRYSFPSGHATRMAAIAVAVGRSSSLAGAIGYLLAILIGLCRIAVGVHYAGDVLVGLLVGTLAALGMVGLLA